MRKQKNIITLLGAGTSSHEKLDPRLVQSKLTDASMSSFSAESAHFDLSAMLKDGSFESKAKLGGVADQLKGVLEAGNDKASFNSRTGMTNAAFTAALGGALVGKYLEAYTSTESAALPSDTRFAPADGLEYPSHYSAESFDNQKLNEFLGISVGLNYKISRQGPAAEMVYRTIALTPDTGGIDLEVPNLYVQNTLVHETDGSPTDFGFRRVIDSSIDYTVLNDNSTKIIPNYNDETAPRFVATGVVQPYDYKEGRRTVLTSDLLFGVTINLFGISQADTIARNGQMDYTDALDRNVGISSITASVGGTVLRWDIRGVPYSRFVKAPEQNARALVLNFPLTTIMLDKNSVDAENNPVSGGVFDLIKNGDYTVRLKTRLAGEVDVEKGDINVSAPTFEVLSIVGPTGLLVDKTVTIGKQIVDGLAGLKGEGWFPDARLTNSNHRKQGLLLNVRPVRERLQTRLRAPFFVPYPIGEDRDQTLMDWLTFTVGNYVNNEAIGALISYHERLYRLTGGTRGKLTVGDYEVNGLAIEGIGRYLVNPYIEEVDVKIFDTAQSVSTVENIENGQEVLLNTVRSLAYDILQRTNYENGCRFVDGGEISRDWKVALVTSKKIERFMTRSGDQRGLGAGLPYQIEGDVDARLSDTMYMTLVREGEGVDIMSAGVMLLTPSLVSNISMTRNGRLAQEAIVQPRFQHYNLLPIIVKINVSGVDALLEQTLPFQVKNQPVESLDGDAEDGTGTSGTGGTVGQPVGQGAADTGAGGAETANARNAGTTIEKE